MFAFIKKIFLAFVLAGVVLFGYQNMTPLSQEISFSFDLYSEGLTYQTPEFPVVFLFISFFLIGVMMAGFGGIFERVARKTEIRLAKRKVKALEKRVSELEGEQTKIDKEKLPPPPKPLSGDKKADEVPSSEKPVAIGATPVKAMLEVPPTKSSPLPLDEEPTL